VTVGGDADDVRPPMGVALHETCRVVAGAVPLWPYHRARLEAGGCGDVVLEDATRVALSAAADWDASPGSRVRLSITVSPDGRASVSVERRLSSLDVPNGPVPVRVDVAGRPPLPRGAAKPADRSWWDDAQRRARAEGGHQAVIVDAEGMVIDGGTATVWIAERGVLVTPPSPGAVAGVARSFLLHEVARVGIEAHVEPLSWDRFERADEALATNAFGGAAAFRGRGGPVCDRVGELFAALWRSRG
jgi:branched-subunit amino acid aminotransferase/4-amino-4-deoxychorismate lyase